LVVDFGVVVVRLFWVAVDFFGGKVDFLSPPNLEGRVVKFGGGFFVTSKLGGGGGEVWWWNFCHLQSGRGWW